MLFGVHNVSCVGFGINHFCSNSQVYSESRMWATGLSQPLLIHSAITDAYLLGQLLLISSPARGAMSMPLLITKSGSPGRRVLNVLEFVLISIILLSLMQMLWQYRQMKSESLLCRASNVVLLRNHVGLARGSIALAEPTVRCEPQGSLLLCADLPVCP